MQNSPMEIRESAIALPTRDDGYATLMLVGTTGAGKTTVLRRLIDSDRFLATSTGRTTTADIEIIAADGPYEAVVTFMGLQEARDEIEKCVLDACRRAVTDASDTQIASALLSPREQRFKLSHLLGTWVSARDNDSRNEEHPERVALEPLEAGEENYQERMSALLSRIKEMAQGVSERTNVTGYTLADAQRSRERDAWMELFEEQLQIEPSFEDLITDILADVKERFAWIEDGSFTESTDDGWPLAWRYESNAWETFLSQVLWFSGNHHRQFGRLLTPLVNGIRVRGPFLSGESLLGSGRKLVILDGEGLGHTARSATSIRSGITNRFPSVDLMLLVDNAQQPMLAASQELVKTAGSMGYASKLAFGFTHFENVIGDDLVNVEDRMDRVRNPGRDAVDAMRSIVGNDVAEDLLDRVESYAFFLESMDKPTVQLPSYSLDELRRLLDTVEEAAHVESRPTGRIKLSSRGFGYGHQRCRGAVP